jgi:hypothetical protein
LQSATAIVPRLPGDICRLVPRYTASHRLSKKIMILIATDQKTTVNRLIIFHFAARSSDA